MDEFFQSVSRAFERNQSAVPSFEWGVLILIVLAVAARFGLVWQWRNSRARAFARFAIDKKISSEDVSVVKKLAQVAAVDPLTFVNDRALFEHTTAGDILIHHQPAHLDALRRIRCALGFHELSLTFPLYTTRALSLGVKAQVSSLQGDVIRVDEGMFAIELPERLSLIEGNLVELVLILHPDVRYSARCMVKLARPADRPRAWEYELGHDEAPVRIQQRQFARVSVHGGIQLHPYLGPLATDDTTHYETGSLRDISGGGALIECQQAHRAGEVLLANFTLDGHDFSSVQAYVLRTKTAPDGMHELQVEFRNMEQVERERLASAVTRANIARYASSKSNPPHSS